MIPVSADPPAQPQAASPESSVGRASVMTECLGSIPSRGTMTPEQERVEETVLTGELVSEETIHVTHVLLIAAAAVIIALIFALTLANVAKQQINSDLDEQIVRSCLERDIAPTPPACVEEMRKALDD